MQWKFFSIILLVVTLTNVNALQCFKCNNTEACTNGLALNLSAQKCTEKEMCGIIVTTVPATTGKIYTRDCYEKLPCDETNKATVTCKSCNTDLCNNSEEKKPVTPEKKDGKGGSGINVLSTILAVTCLFTISFFKITF